MIPRLCREILKSKDKWIPQAQSESSMRNLISLFEIRKAKRQLRKGASLGPSFSGGDLSSVEDVDEHAAVCPVICYSSFEEGVRSIDPLASTDLIRIAGNYLQDMGEVSLLQFVVAFEYPIKYIS